VQYIFFKNTNVEPLYHIAARVRALYPIMINQKLCLINRQKAPLIDY